MRWTYENFTMLVFGVAVGMWGSGWLALISPWVPLFLSYPVAGWVLWRTQEIVRRRANQKSILDILARRALLMAEWETLGDELFVLTNRKSDQ